MENSKSVLKLLLEAKNMPHLIEQVLSYLYLKDLKIVKQVSTDLKRFVDDVYKKRRAKISRELEINGFEFNDEVDNDGKTLLWKATKDGNLDLMMILLENGANVGQGDYNGNRPLDIAIREGNLDAVKLLIEEGKADYQTRNGRLLQMACSLGDVNILQYLITKGINLNEGSLHYATEREDVDTIRVLIENGANPDVKHNGQTALHFATTRGYTEVVQALISSGANVNETDQWGRSALLQASTYGKVNVMKMFIKAGADVEQADKNGVRSIHWVARYGKLEALKLLIEEGKADVKSKTHSGGNLLHQSACNKNIECFEVFQYCMSFKFDVNEADNDGKTALWFASEAGNINAMKLFINEGANVEQADKNGYTPLHAAAKGSRLEAFKWLLDEGKANLHALDKWGRNVLIVASSCSGCPAGWINPHLDPILEYIFSTSIGINEVDNQGMSALYLSSDNGQVQAMKKLIEFGADVNQVDKIGFAPLHKAAYEGRLNAVKVLLDSENINMNAKVFGKFSPIDIAKIRGHKDIVDYLKSKGASTSSFNNCFSRALFYGSLNFRIKNRINSTHRLSIREPKR